MIIHIANNNDFLFGHQNSGKDMAPENYIIKVIRFLENQGWTTNRNQVREDTYVITGKRDSIDGQERAVVMVIIGSEGSTEHLKYLSQVSNKKDADKTGLTSDIGVSDKIRNEAQKNNVGVIEYETVLREVEEETDSTAFNVSVDEISFDKGESQSQDSLSTDIQSVDRSQSKTYSSNTGFSTAEQQSSNTQATSKPDNPYDVAKELEISAVGNIKVDYLVDSESEKPIVSYLDADEQPQFKFHNQRKGFRIEHPNWDNKKTPHNVSFSHPGYRYLFLTSQRVLFIAGDPDNGDEVISIPYTEIIDVNSKCGITKQYISFETESQKQLTFFDSGHDAEHLDDAEDYVKSNI